MRRIKLLKSYNVLDLTNNNRKTLTYPSGTILIKHPDGGYVNKRISNHITIYPQMYDFVPVANFKLIPLDGDYSDFIGKTHAVRWGKYILKRDGNSTVYTKWHGSYDSEYTLCNRPITVISDKWPFLPETDEELDTIDCKYCISILNRMKKSKKYE